MTLPSELPLEIAQLYPEAARVALADVYRDLAWRPRAEDRPFLALNMVGTVDGRAAVDGSSMGIGSPVDRHLMRVLRANADALLFGAGTLRAERVGRGVPAEFVPLRQARGLAPQPLLALLTASGDVPLKRAFFAEPARAVVFVAERTPRDRLARLRERATVRVVGADRPDPAAALRVLRQEFGARAVLCEGGPTLNRDLLALGVLDDLFVTLEPKAVAGDGLPLVAGAALVPPVRLALRSLYEHAGELYLRYSIRT